MPDRHLDITFRLQLVESSSFDSVLFREAFNQPYISFFRLFLLHVLVSVPSFNWWVVSVGGEELKGCQHHQLTSQQGPHFSPRSKAITNYKSTNLRNIGN